MSGATGDYVIQVGQRFKTNVSVASVDEALSEDRWRVSWSERGGGCSIYTSYAIRCWIVYGSWVPIEPYEAPRAESVANLKDKMAGVRRSAPLCCQRIGEDRVCHAEWTEEPGWRRWDVEDDQQPVLAVGVVLCPFHAREEADADRQIKALNELAWWRTQFSTRFPEGELPKPGTPLVGKRYHLSEGEYDPGTSFHVGIDVGGSSKTILSLVEGGKVVAMARIDVEAEIAALGKTCLSYRGIFQILDREVRNLARLFLPATNYRDRLLCLGNCGDSVEQRPGEFSWVCAACAQKPVPIADQRWTPRPDAPQTCCRIGGEMALDGKTCPLHPPAYVPEFDTFNFLRP